MPKPLIPTTFFSFPKLLLWSLPLLLIFTYTYLDNSFIAHLTPFLSFSRLDYWKSPNSTAPVPHDFSFSPDFVLRVTEEPFTQSCVGKQAVVLVNGTSPGPEIRLLEGNVYWIRVFNDMGGRNLTMV